jgi:serine protease Do
MQVYDVILKINEHEIQNAQDLVNTVSSFMPDTTITVEIWRDENKITLPIVLGERNIELSKQIVQKKKILGMTFDELNNQNREKWNISQDYQGVLIESIESGSPAEEAGLLPGDVILEVQRKAIKSVEDLLSFFSKWTDTGKPLIIRYVRGTEEPDITAIEPMNQ